MDIEKSLEDVLYSTRIEINSRLKQLPKKDADKIRKNEIAMNLRTGQVRIIDRAGDKLLYSKSEVAALLSVSLVSVCRYLKAGLLPSVQLGGRRLIPREALIEWITKRTNE